MRRTLLLASLVLIVSATLATPASADPRCAVIRGSGTAEQEGGAFTPWEGPVTVRIRGRVLEGWVTLLSTDANAPVAPPFRLVGFSKLTYDFGEVGSFSTWGVTEFIPDDTFYNWEFTGHEVLGSPLEDLFAWGTGAFAVATGWLTPNGSMRFADPPPPGVPNNLDVVFRGRICGIDWSFLPNDDDDSE